MAPYQRTVLIVEDEPFIRMDLSEALADAGYRVLEAGSVLAAIGLLSRHGRIDGLITDIDLPGNLSGLDLVELVAQCNPAAARIVVSGGTTLAEEGPRDFRFIPKPYSLGEVVRTLDWMISSTVANRPLRRVGR